MGCRDGSVEGCGDPSVVQDPVGQCLAPSRVGRNAIWELLERFGSSRAKQHKGEWIERYL